MLVLRVGVASGQELVERPIAFVTDRDGNAEIYVVNPDGSELRNLTQDPAHDAMPQWSPDGTRIAFLSDVTERSPNNPDDAGKLVVVDADGLDRITLAPHAYRFVWSPQGDRIAYADGSSGRNSAIWIAAADGSSRERLAAGGQLAWSPDGSRLAITRQTWIGGGPVARTLDEVVVVDPFSHAETVVHEVLGFLTVSTVRMYSPVWLPDASGIVASHGAFSGMGHRQGSTVVIVSTDGSETTRTELRRSQALSVSPDRRLLLFTTIYAWFEDPSPTLYVTALDGADKRELAGQIPFGPYLASPSWGPEGQQLVAELRPVSGGVADLYIVPIDGSPRVQLTTAGGRQPDWGSAGSPPVVRLPRIDIVSPSRPKRLPSGSTSLQLEVRLRDHAGSWQWRLNSTFPSEGPGGGTTVAAGQATTVPGLADGRLYSLDVAMVDAEGAVLTPHFRTSQTFSVAPPEPSAGLSRTWIVFSVRRPGPTTHLYVARPDGSDLAQITHGDVTDERPSWAPDGSRIVFQTRNEDRRTSLVVVNADGTGRTRITGEDTNATDPDWSPDGQSIAFSAEAPENLPQIYVMDADGSNRRRLTRSPVGVREPAWSSDGSRIAYTSGQLDRTGIGVIGVDGTSVPRLRISGNGSTYAPAWSPSDDFIAYGRAAASGGPQLHVLDIQSGLSANLGLQASFGSWSPDGSMIVSGGGSVRTIRVDREAHAPFDPGVSASGIPDWLPLIPTNPSSEPVVGAQVRVGLARYRFPPNVAGLSRSGVRVDVAEEGVLQAGHLVRLGASLCAEVGDRQGRTVVGRDGRIVGGSDFDIAPGRSYIVSGVGPIQVTLAPDSQLTVDAKSQEAWAFATVTLVGDYATIAPGAQMRVTSERTGEAITGDPSSGAFVALFTSPDGGPVVERGSAFTFQLVENGGYPLGVPARRVVSESDLELASLVVEIDAQPDATRPLPNYPNPFNPETWMPFQLDRRADVDIRIYSAGGALVRLLQLGALDAGYYVSRDRAARWDGRNANGETAAAGVYFTELRAGGQRLLRRMVLRK